jgi:fatty acid desaturase
MDDAGQRISVQTDGNPAKAGARGSRRRRWSRGYSNAALPQAVHEQLKAFEATSLSASVFDCVVYFASIVLVAGLTVMAWRFDQMLGAVCYVLILLFIARQQRAIELMVHDASHWAWDRNNKIRNDQVADALVAYPVMSTVDAYRKGHFIHHGTYAGEQDPCKRRFAAMGLGHVDLSTKARIAKAVLRWLPAYNLAYYTEIGSKTWGMLLRWAVWHLVIFIAPLSFLFGGDMALLYWSMFWLVPMFTSLPVLRSIAEAEEHDYERGETELDSTFTNNGWIHHLLWHPWNDAYHQIHHLYPNISQRLHHKVHRLLMQHDAQYRRSPMRVSTLQKMPMQ